jgi:hypothetical protein
MVSDLYHTLQLDFQPDPTWSWAHLPSSALLGYILPPFPPELLVVTCSSFPSSSEPLYYLFPCNSGVIASRKPSPKLLFLVIFISQRIVVLSYEALTLAVNMYPEM